MKFRFLYCLTCVFIYFVPLMFILLLSTQNVYSRDVTLIWNSNSEEELVAGYRIFYREEDQNYDYLCEGVESPPIDDVVNIVEFCNPWGMGGLGYYYTKYALLQDGSVWKWEASHSAEGSPIPFIEPLIGSAIFLAIAFIIVLIFLFDDLLNNLSEKAKLDDN